MSFPDVLSARIAPTASDVADAFKEGIRDVAEDLEEVPTIVRSWRWQHSMVAGVLGALLIGSLLWLGTFLAHKPDLSQYVDLDTHQKLQKAYANVAAVRDEAVRRAAKAEQTVSGQAAELKSLRERLFTAELGLRSDAYIDRLNGDKK